MTEIKRNDKGEITGVTYADSDGYTVTVEPSSRPNAIRIWTKNNVGGGSPVDLDRAEAKRFAHDVIELAGGEG